MNKNAGVDQINSIFDKIANSKIKLAIEDTLKLLRILSGQDSDTEIYIYDDVESSLLSLQGRLTRLTKKQKSGRLKSKNYEIKLNRIIATLLSLVGEVKKAVLKGKELNDNDRRLVYPGFIKKDVSEVLNEVCDFLADARSIRVVGENRQQMNDKYPSKIINRYYDEIENRLSSDFEGTQSLMYKRITSGELTKGYKKHLENCLIAAKSNKNLFEVAFIDNLLLAYTYLIITSIKGESIIVLNLYTIDDDTKVFDTSCMFVSYDNEIVNQYKKHFDLAWDKEGKNNIIINNLIDFENFIPLDEKVRKDLSDINRYTNLTPKKSMRFMHVRYHLALIKYRLQGIKNARLEIKHTRKNQRISTAYNWYIKQLSKGSQYKSISVLEFWEGLDDIDKFIEFHEKIFKQKNNGGKVTRIFIVDENKIMNDSYSKRCKYVLSKNFELSKKYQNNYEFEILFTKKYQKFLKRNKNFAIWQRENDYGVVFLSEYSSKPKTRLLFYEEWNRKHSNYFRNKDTFSEASKDILSQLETVYKQKEEFKKALDLINGKPSKEKISKKMIKRYSSIKTFLGKCRIDSTVYLQ